MTSEDDPTQEKPDAPSHMLLLAARARAYQDYMSQLKGGSRSGISDVFGSAEDLFSAPVDVPPVLKLDTTKLRPGEDELPLRSFYLARLHIKAAQAFLTAHMSACRRGDYGDFARQQAQKDVPTPVLSAAAKALSCVTGYLTALEQGILDESDETWQQEIFGNFMLALDKLLPEPSCDEVLQQYGQFEFSKICQKLPSGLAVTIGFGETGDPSWNAFRQFLLCGGNERHDIWKNSLALSVDQLNQLTSD